LATAAGIVQSKGILTLIRFTFNPAKFVNAVAWLATECPHCTKMKICKLLYFADKEHLLQYGRPIIGDTYYKLKDGPIPTKGLNVLRGQSGPATDALLREFVDVGAWAVTPKKAADLSVFSKSDLRVLNHIKETLGALTAYQLRDLSHEEQAYKASEMHEAMDFELIVKDSADAETLRSFMESEQHTRDSLLRYRAVTV
jgi:uncharacterized phage-associated protein